MDGYKKYRTFTERECFEWLVTQCLPAYMASPEYEVTLKKTYSEEVGIHRPPLSVTNSASKEEVRCVDSVYHEVTSYHQSNDFILTPLSLLDPSIAPLVAASANLVRGR